MYFYIKPINNNTYYNKEALSVIKNLQSLGVGATGRLSTDRQTLQMAEYEKLKQILSPTNEQKIQNAEVPFNAIINNGAVENNTAMAQVAAGTQNNNNEVANAAKEQTGATQLAELNKLMHNIAA